LAVAALAVFLPVSSFALFHHNQRPKPDRPPGHPVHAPGNHYKAPKHPHVPFGHHENSRGKGYGKQVKEHFKAAKAEKKH
jgi:hypothetical protein